MLSPSDTEKNMNESDVESVNRHQCRPILCFDSAKPPTFASASTIDRHKSKYDVRQKHKRLYLA